MEKVMNEVANHREIFYEIQRHMFAIETMSGISRAELDSHWYSDEQKLKMVAEELDIINIAAKRIKDLLKVTT